MVTITYYKTSHKKKYNLSPNRIERYRWHGWVQARTFFLPDVHKLLKCTSKIKPTTPSKANKIPKYTTTFYMNLCHYKYRSFPNETLKQKRKTAMLRLRELTQAQKNWYLILISKWCTLVTLKFTCNTKPL